MNTLLKTLKTLLRPTTPVGHFVHHYLQMVVAMLVGMIVLGPVWSLAGNALASPPSCINPNRPYSSWPPT